MSKLVCTLKQALLGENEGIKNELQTLLTNMTANKPANSNDDSGDVNDSIKTKMLGSNEDMESDDSTPQTPNLNTADMDRETPVVNTPNNHSGDNATLDDDDSDATDMNTVVKHFLKLRRTGSLMTILLLSHRLIPLRRHKQTHLLHPPS
jgi:hypothetical protein